MTEENKSTIEQLKKKLDQLEVELLENFSTPEQWGTAELARHHARRLSVARMYLLDVDPFLTDHLRRHWPAIARVLHAEIFLRELGGEK